MPGHLSFHPLLHDKQLRRTSAVPFSNDEPSAGSKTIERYRDNMIAGRELSFEERGV